MDIQSTRSRTLRSQGTQSIAHLEPLERITVLGTDTGVIVVTDGRGREYARFPAGPEAQFVVGGAPGQHLILWKDPTGAIRENLPFLLKARTDIRDQGELFHKLLLMAHYSLVHPTPFHAYENDICYQGRIYHIRASWLRYHVYALKGLKYFDHDLKDGIDLYRDSQRRDGLIWDNILPRATHDRFWDMILSYGDFILPIENETFEFRRIPVENDLEYLFVEGLYHTWKAVGDDAWMMVSLDAAMKALEYSITSPYRWSRTYQLLKRGYTIDTWDFQAEGEYTSPFLHDIMHIDAEHTRFGVMFGDNTGYAMACRYLAEMLAYAGRTQEAERYHRRGQEIQQRIDALSWNGHYYTHHVSEDPDVKRDLGVDEASQISLSNAFSLNRTLSHEQCVAIIQTYQRIQQNLPEGSPGEWYTIYPPFPRGFNEMWHTLNGAVTPLVAGELARGAFQHGFEAYAVDILRRVYHLGQKHHHLYGTYVGAYTRPPERTCTPLDISTLANIDVSGEGRMGAPGWTGEGINDLHEMPCGTQTLAGVPFLIPDPEQNNGRACIGLSIRDRYTRRAILSIGTHAACIYFLHTSAHTPNGIAGMITLHYADGSVFSQYVVRGRNISGWWMPAAPDAGAVRPVTQVAWCGKNEVCKSVGVIAYGLDNPYPELVIERITLSATEDGALWAVLGVTLSDQPAYFEPDQMSVGVPDSCAAGGVISALVEGLAGVVDDGVGYNRVTLAPRWTVAEIEQSHVVVCYPDSSGYVAYTYTHDVQQNAIAFIITGSGEQCRCHVLLPEGVVGIQQVQEAKVHLDYELSHVESSLYVDFTLALPGPRFVSIIYEVSGEKNASQSD